MPEWEEKLRELSDSSGGGGVLGGGGGGGGVGAPTSLRGSVFLLKKNTRKTSQSRGG